jgi:hypothetical protein
MFNADIEIIKTIITAVTPFGLAAGAWWLAQQFKKQDVAIAKQDVVNTQRHISNIQRMGKIERTLAVIADRVGYRMSGNGNGDGESEQR